MLVVVIIVGTALRTSTAMVRDPAVQITGVRGVAASEQRSGRKRYKKKNSALSLWHWKRALFLRASTPPIPNYAPVKR